MSDSSDSSDVPTASVFKYKKKAFKKREPEPDSDDSDSDIDVFAKRRPATKSLEQKMNDDEEFDVESDDDDDIIEVASNPKPGQIIDMCEYSSDEDGYEDYEAISKMALAQNKDSLDVIRKSRQAKLELQRAQQYHAEDIRIGDDDDADYNNNVMDDIELPSASSRGRELTVEIIVNGTRFKRTIRKLEPLQKLMDRLRADFLVSESDVTTLSLKGREVELTKTPASYQLVGNELFSFNVVVKEKPKQQQLGPSLTLMLRTIKGGKMEAEDEFQLRSGEPFSKLLAMYKEKKKYSARKKVVLVFDGDALGMIQTPETHDMESDDIIDVNVK